MRGEIVFADRAKARQKLGLSDSDRLVVSFWGSMGAKYMNEHMAGMLALETRQGSTFRHIHATGSAAFQWLPKMACEQGAKLTGGNIEVTEYIYDMASYMAAADLVICRAGAATIGELCALGKPSIMVPLALRGREPSGEERACARACRRVRGAAGEGRDPPQTLLEMTERLLADDAASGRDEPRSGRPCAAGRRRKDLPADLCRSCADLRGRTGRGFGMAKRENERAQSEKSGSS